jgi:protease-4
MSRTSAAAFTAAGLVLLALPAGAQRPTGGVVQPTADVAAGDHAEALEDNPAGIGFGTDFDLTYTFVDAREDLPGEGHAVFASLGILDPYHTGVGLQFLELGGPTATKVTWGHALRFGEGMTLGFNWHSFVSDDHPTLDGFDTYDLGLQLRPLRWIAAGVTMTDFTTPDLGGETVERGWELGLALRPGVEWLTASGRARLPENGDPNIFGARLQSELAGGFGILARYDTTEDPVTGDRVHQLLVGLTDQLVRQVNVGLFAYLPDATNSDRRNGLATQVRLSALPEGPEPTMRQPQVVELNLNEGLEEYAPGGFFETAPRTPFLDTVATLRALEDREDVQGLLVTVTGPEVGWARAAELRDALARLKARGKRIYGAPAGGLLVTGLMGEQLYIGTLLDKVGVNAQFVALEEYKTAPELFTRTGPSPAAQEVQSALLDDLYARLLGRIGEGRQLSPEQVGALIDKAPYTAHKAREAGLLDGVIHYDEFEDILDDDFGGNVRFTGAADLLARREARWGRLPEIAVLFATGTITDGPSLANPFTGSVTTGADSFVREVRRLRDDPYVRAVVLRVDSPGGSVTASDVMWRELTLLGREKPLIVSMGDIAASGGYYVAAPGREIFAQPDTITGSIGIFTGKFDVSGLYWWLGLHKEITTRGARADLLTETRPWDEAEREVVRAGMRTLYDLFLQRVDEGRQNLDRDAVAAVAKGRVWTGAQALANGLVDQSGGLIDAIERAEAIAGLDRDDYIIGRYPEIFGFGGLPGSPLGFLGIGERAESGGAWRWLAALVPPASALALPPQIPEAFAQLLELPIGAFARGEPLALHPFVGRF